jgi:hypothetical protein
LCAAALPPYRTPPTFGSTYLTLYNFTRTFTSERWQAEMAHMKALNISEIIVGSTMNVNWCDDSCVARGNTALGFYPTQIAGVESGPPIVEAVLDAADAVGLRVTLGLFVGGFNHSVSMLTYLAQMNSAMASELYALYAGHQSFAGFHVPMELKNCINCSQRGWDGQINFNTPELRQRLIDVYVNPICDHIMSLAPHLPVGMPPSFFDKNSFLGQVNGTWMEAAPWGEWMEAFLVQVPNLNRFTYQDCVGSSIFSYPFADTVEYFRALRRAVDSANKRRARPFQFWSDLESFTFLQDYWVPAAVSTRKPAAMRRITGQLAAEASLVDGFTTYEWLFYLSPSGAPQVTQGAKGDIPHQSINSNASLQNFLEYSRYLQMGAPPSSAHAPPWTLELASTGWSYNLSRPPDAGTLRASDAPPANLTAAGALISPGPLIDRQLAWSGFEPIRVRLAVPASRDVDAINLRAFCALDHAVGAALPEVEAYVAGTRVGALTPTREEDGVVSVLNLLLDSPSRVRAGDTIDFVLTPTAPPSGGVAALGEGRKILSSEAATASPSTLCARLEVYSQPSK